jgi:hypothetical protein
MVLEIYMRGQSSVTVTKRLITKPSLFPSGVKLNPVELDGWRELGLEGCGGVTDDELLEDFKEVKNGDTLAAFQAVTSPPSMLSQR